MADHTTRASLSPAQAHAALCEVLAALHGQGWDRDGAIARYAAGAWASHALAAADPVAAVNALVAVSDDRRPVETYTRCLTHAPAILAALGPEHPDTLTTRNILASLRGQAGDAAGAAAAYADLLPVVERVLGPEHPDTLTTRSNLASLRGQAGDAAGAAAAYADLLPVHERVLGPDHPHTLTIRSNLARWRRQASDR